MHGTVDELLPMDIQSSRGFTGGSLCPAGDPCRGGKITVTRGLQPLREFPGGQSPTDGTPAASGTAGQARFEIDVETGTRWESRAPKKITGR